MTTEITLTIRQGPGEGTSAQLTPGEQLLVGRGAFCHLQVGDDPCVSRCHFLVELRPIGLYLLDVGSRYGTLVNGEQTRGSLLSHLDRIQIGETTELEVWAPSLAGEPAVAPVEAVAPITLTQLLPRQPVSELPFPKSADPAPSAISHAQFDDPSLAAVALVHQHDTEEIAGRIPDIPGYQFLECLVTHRDTGVDVWKATRDQTGGLCLVKVWYVSGLARGMPSDQYGDLVFRRILPLHLLDHPRIVQFLGGTPTRDYFCIVMEYVDGPSAEGLRMSGHLFSDAEVVRVGVQVCEALQYAHSRRVIHCNLRPSNLLIRNVPNLDVLVTDFGQSRFFGEVRNLKTVPAHAARYTWGFLAPEVIADPQSADRRSDIYGLGATLYWLLTGAVPAEVAGGHLEVSDVLEGNLVPVFRWRPQTAAGLARVIHQALQLDPDKRFQSALEMQEALAGALA